MGAVLENCLFVAEFLEKGMSARFFLLSGLLLLLAGCSGPPWYEYRYVPGRTAVLQRDGRAVAPPAAPPKVHAAIEAGNRIAGLPYLRGGGHGVAEARGYDCSGSASYILRSAGLLRGSMPSSAFRSYGEPGEGEWITLHARKDHVFLVIAGLRFDTGWTRAPEGPQWTTGPRPLDDSVARHPRGL